MWAFVNPVVCHSCFAPRHDIAQRRFVHLGKMWDLVHWGLPIIAYYLTNYKARCTRDSSERIELSDKRPWSKSHMPSGKENTEVQRLLAPLPHLKGALSRSTQESAHFRELWCASTLSTLITSSSGTVGWYAYVSCCVCINEGDSVAAINTSKAHARRGVRVT